MTDLSHQQLSAILPRVRAALGTMQITDPGLLSDLQQAEQRLDAHPMPLPVDARQ